MTALVLALTAGGAGAAPKQELDEVRARIKALQDDLRAGEQSHAEAADQLRASETAISRANRQLRDLARQRATVREKLRSLQAEAGRLRSEIARQQAEIGHGLRDRYMHGRVAPLRLAMAGSNPNRVARDLRYLDYIARARTALVDSYRANVASIAALEEQADEKAQALAALEADHREQKASLEREKSERGKVLAAISSELAKNRKEFATLRRDEERLANLVARLARALARPKPSPKQPGVTNTATPERLDEDSTFRKLKGKLRLPVAGELMTRFGSPRGDDGFSRKGIFIRARPGQDVKAIATGQVVFADWMRGFGNLLIIDHGNGFMSLYGNNESLLKGPGDTVQTGDVVASVGASGGQEESGLYFELRHDGTAIDPLPWAPPR